MKSYGSLKTESELTKLDDYQVAVHPQVPSLVLAAVAAINFIQMYWPCKHTHQP